MKPIKINRRQIVLASLVLALGTAVYLNWQFSPKSIIKPFSKEVITPLNEENLDFSNFSNNEKNKNNSKYFENARLKRQDAREKSLKSIEEILSNNEIDDKTKFNLSKELSERSQQILTETNIENVVDAKLETKNCIAMMNGKECTLIVSKEGKFEQNDANIICDVIRSLAKCKNEEIKIIPR
ncbi:MAG: SpoIIIAH-like family protein [Oscillospiraceae bacterium]|nr:SpoIIIAH-like family protein [Oscillospiraceae bacterium]